jgi:hypothetical protein
MTAKRENRFKQYVSVRADHMPDGSVLPRVFKFTDSRGETVVCHIDAVLDIREAPSLKAGGQGMRYTCRVGENQYYLFHDDLYWFVEL